MSEKTPEKSPIGSLLLGLSLFFVVAITLAFDVVSIALGSNVRVFDIRMTHLIFVGTLLVLDFFAVTLYEIKQKLSRVEDDYYLLTKKQYLKILILEWLIWAVVLFFFIGINYRIAYDTVMTSVFSVDIKTNAYGNHIEIDTELYNTGITMKFSPLSLVIFLLIIALLYFYVKLVDKYSYARKVVEERIGIISTMLGATLGIIGLIYFVELVIACVVLAIEGFNIFPATLLPLFAPIVLIEYLYMALLTEKYAKIAIGKSFPEYIKEVYQELKKELSG